MKFKIGDKVKCFREGTKDWYGFDFEGEVKWGDDTGDGVEYSVTNAPDTVFGPMLIWETEMDLVVVRAVHVETGSRHLRFPCFFGRW